MNWLLIVVLAILVGNAFVGRKIGFIKTIFSLCSMIIALLLTAWISPSVNHLLKSNDKFVDYVTERVEKILPLEEADVKEDSETESDFIDGLPLPKSLKETLVQNNNADTYGALAINSFREYISSYLANVIINALAFVVTFLTAIIALWVISIVLDLISKLPILNSINKTAGLIAGLIQGLVIVWILFVLLTVFGGTDLGKDAFQMIEESPALSILYDNNLLMDFVLNAAKLFKP
ncbi:MAG: hypothetical protein K0S47_4136 [Herbinix sp.]|jgi:uncharacterized membrane protein required for colicin V production|nr:hypothetical protein [Herbinix sp.]